MLQDEKVPATNRWKRRRRRRSRRKRNDAFTLGSRTVSLRRVSPLRSLFLLPMQTRNLFPVSLSLSCSSLLIAHTHTSMTPPLLFRGRSVDSQQSQWWGNKINKRRPGLLFRTISLWRCKSRRRRAPRKLCVSNSSPCCLSFSLPLPRFPVLLLLVLLVVVLEYYSTLHHHYG